MLSIAHAAAGAFIATKINNPWLSGPIIVATHFLQDYIPHWDVGQGLTKKLKSKHAAFIQELVTDFPASIIFVYFLYQASSTSINYQAWFGWFMALLPDFLEFPYLFLNLRFFPIKQIANLHNRFHHSTPNKWKGLWPQILVILLVLYFA